MGEEVRTTIRVDGQEINEAAGRTERLADKLNAVRRRAAERAGQGPAPTAAERAQTAAASARGAIGGALAAAGPLGSVIGAAIAINTVTERVKLGVLDALRKGTGAGGAVSGALREIGRAALEATNEIPPVKIFNAVREIYNELERQQQVRVEARAAAERGRANLEARLSDDPRVRADAARALNEAYRARMEADAAAAAGAGGTPGGF